MDDSSKSRMRVWGPLLMSLTLAGGMLIGFNLRDTLRHKRNITTIIQRNDRLEQIIDLINERYVDTLDRNALYRDAVEGILSHLDPHTVYIPADRLESINEDLEGSFFGIGVEFNIIRDTIQITAVVEDGPAEIAGVGVGDRLVKVGDSVVAGTGITSERIISMLKGKKFSKVFLTMLEPGSDKPKVIGLKRDAVPNYSVDASMMLDDATGLIKINRFSATTHKEFIKHLLALKEKGAENLVVDLRQNTGGYVEPAKEIADEFLSDDKLIVITNGTNSVEHEYVAERTGEFETGKLVVLVDEQSASASEILAGAIQDWDRGVIIGRRTFGKGLVQDQYLLDDGSALRLTIARYYTPSGRSLQRSFDDGKEQYTEDYVHRFETGELTGFDTVVNEDTTRFYTANNRVVYGGGGIRPDIYVPYDTVKLSTSLLNLIFSDGVKNVIWDYHSKHRNDLRLYKDVKQFKKEFKADTLVKLYVNSLDKPTARVVKLTLNDERYRKYFTLHMKAQLARMLFRQEGYYSIIFSDDNMVKTALKVLNGKEYSEVTGR